MLKEWSSLSSRALIQTRCITPQLSLPPTYYTHILHRWSCHHSTVMKDHNSNFNHTLHLCSHMIEVNLHIFGVLIASLSFKGLQFIQTSLYSSTSLFVRRTQNNLYSFMGQWWFSWYSLLVDDAKSNKFLCLLLLFMSRPNENKCSWVKGTSY